MHASPLDAVRIFAALMLAAALVGLGSARLRIPSSVGLVVVGLVGGLAIPAGSLAVTPDLVLAVLLPGLVFDAAFRTHVDPFRWARARILFLAVPGVIVTAGVVAVVLATVTGLSPGGGFLVGAMVAATDPVAVVGTFRRSPVPLRLRTLVEGESIFNDGTGLALFAVAVGISERPDPVSVAGSFVAVIVGSSVIGVAVAWISIRLHRLIDDHLVEATITVAAAYGAYVLAEWVGGSGLLATAVAGLLIGSRRSTAAISAESARALDLVWEVAAFVLTALAFLLVGVAIPLSTLASSAGPIAAGVIAVALARLVVVYGLLGGGGRLVDLLGRRFRRGGRVVRSEPLPTAWLHVLTIAGMRGAVSVALALALPLSNPERDLIQAVTLGIVVVSLLGLGLAAGPLVPRLLAVDAAAADWIGRPDASTADPDLAEALVEEAFAGREPEDL